MAKPRPQTNAAFGQVILSRRLAAGLTQEEVAARAGVDPTYVSQLERGRRSPSLAVIVGLAEALATTATELVAAAERSTRESE